MTIRSQTQIAGFGKPMLTKLQDTLASIASFLAGPPMSERARLHYAITDFAITEAQVRRDKALAFAWAQYPVLGGL